MEHCSRKDGQDPWRDPVRIEAGKSTTYIVNAAAQSIKFIK